MTPDAVLRPVTGLRGVLAALLLRALPVLFALLRRFWPIPHLGRYYAVTRHDDVREVFLNDAAFAVPYAPKLSVIMGGEPFFLGMADGPDYRRDTQAMRLAVRREDIGSRLAPATLAQAETAVAAAGGRIEVVDALARQVTFDVLCAYFGVPPPAQGSLPVWAMRLFEFQFADRGDDPDLRAEVDRIAPALRAHIDAQLAARREAADPGDDVLGRCLRFQAEGRPGFSDAQIRSALIGFIVGGLPQPPMVVPQALEQLLRRPQALAQAQAAAGRGDDAALAACVFEALRFDPLAPALMRTAVRAQRIAAGTSRATCIPAGAMVAVAFASAMRDPRRVARPEQFRLDRPACVDLHFGHGLHGCFGTHINRVLIPLMLKPLLQRPGLRRAPGRDGHLRKEGPFAARLVVDYTV